MSSFNKIRSKNNLSLLWVLAKTDFKLRYHGSALGYFWSLLKPLLMFGVLYVVFSVLMRWDIVHYQVYLLLGIIVWNFFAEGTMAGLNALIAKANIIKKVYFPRFLIVIASTISAFITLLLNILVFFVIYFLSGLSFNFWMLLFPLYLLLMYLFVVGMSLILSVMQVKYRDVIQVWEVVLQAGFFLSPIIYPMEMVPKEYVFFLFLNPITGIVEFSRGLVIEHRLPDLYGTLYVFGVIVLVFLVGLLIFSRLSHKVAEEL